MGTYKQIIDSLGADLLELCKQKKDKHSMTFEAERLLQAGADANFKGCRPMYFAVKNYNFPLIRLLIDHGALENPVCRRFLAGMSERGSFDEKRKDAFFEIIDYAAKRTGFDIEYLAHFINMALVSQQLDSLYEAVERYGIEIGEAIGCVKQMIIFEVIDLKKEQSLALINKHLDWGKDAIDTAVAAGQSAAASYILKKHADIRPTKESIVRAIAAGHVDMLRTLDENGISLADEGFVKTACRCAKLNIAPLQFFADKGLLKNGIGGKSIYQIAKEWEDPALSEFVKTMPIDGL